MATKKEVTKTENETPMAEVKKITKASNKVTKEEKVDVPAEQITESINDVKTEQDSVTPVKEQPNVEEQTVDVKKEEPKVEEKPVEVKKDEPKKVLNKVESAKSKSTNYVGTYTVTGCSELALRYGAGKTKAAITTMPEGTKVICYGFYDMVDNTPWLLVKYKNHTGFCSKKYLK